MSRKLLCAECSKKLTRAEKTIGALPKLKQQRRPPTTAEIGAVIFRTANKWIGPEGPTQESFANFAAVLWVEAFNHALTVCGIDPDHLLPVMKQPTYEDSGWMRWRK